MVRCFITVILLTHVLGGCSLTCQEEKDGSGIA